VGRNISVFIEIFISHQRYSNHIDHYQTKYETNPYLWVVEMLKVFLWSMQRQIFDSVFAHRKTVVRSCHGSGKTFVAAVIVLAFLFTKAPCKVITTAPTWYQVRDILWSIINQLYKRRLMDRFPGNPQNTRLVVNDAWFAVGLSPKDSHNFQGYHSRNVLIVVDECPGVRKELINGLNSLMSAGNAHCLWIGNPVVAGDHFYDAFRDPSFHKISISAFDTPNFTSEAVPQAVADELVSPEWVEEMKQEWGESSALYISRVLGDFPPAGENQVIPLNLCEEAARREVQPDGQMELGVDVALFGTDLTVYTRKSGLVVLDQTTDSQRDPMQVSGRISRMNQRDAYTSIRIDPIGIGSGVLARLRELGLPATGVDVRNRANDPAKYYNRRAELWFNMAEWLKYGRIPDDTRLMADLTAPQYTYASDGRYKLEPKESMKKRLGRSPDFGDSAVIAVGDMKHKEPRRGRVWI
ncbi:hypothetical protein ACFL6S_00485, partial [Candidatus Poribacteria bacterium]